MNKIIAYTLGLPKSIYVNFRLCSFKDAIKLPILVSNKTNLLSLKGSASFDNVKTGVVQIGFKFRSAETFDYKYDRSVLSIKGSVLFRGKTRIGQASKLSVHGKLILGDNFDISAASTINCREEIEFGKNVIVSWDCLIMDTDFHRIFDVNGNHVNANKKVFVGDNCWIGARSSILKGAYLADHSIVGLGSVVVNKYETKNTIMAGNPIKIIKKNVTWKK